jgi:O-succinylbenzoic acid--CoA ligase
MVVDLLAWVLADGAGRTVDPDSTALLWPGGSCTYQELNGRVDERARALAGEGLEPGSIRPIVASNDVAGVITLLAVWRCGAIAAPLNPGLARREFAAATRALSVGAATAGQLILWTSGTVGAARGVELSFDNLRASAMAVGGRLDLGPDDVWLASLSTAHVGGVALVTRALMMGSAVFAAGPFDVEVASKVVGTPVTHASFVPTQLLRMLDHRPSRPPTSFRCALIGGAHAPPDLVARALDAGWPISLTYGMTEMASQVATATPRQVRAKPGTVGSPLDGVELRTDERGQLLVRGATRAVGYVGSDEAMADADGWYRTGDLGYIDEAGDVWVTGRRIDRIVSGGVTVDAIEVEGVLRAHPSVADACVVGVQDAEWGEVVGAVVVPVEGEFDLDALDVALRESLSAAKRPRLWWVASELPLNANGKVERARVRSLLEDGRALQN